MEIANFLKCVLDHTVDVLHVAGAARLISGFLSPERFMFVRRPVSVYLLSLCLFLFSVFFLHLLTLFAFTRAIAGAPPFLLLWHGKRFSLGLLFWCGRPCSISVDPRNFRLGRWVWRSRFWLTGGRWRFSVAFGVRYGSAVYVFATAIILFGLLGSTSDAGVQYSGGGLGAAGGAFTRLAGF